MVRNLILCCVIFAGISLSATVHNVYDYGAIGNDEIDDTEAIQKAINAASRTNNGGEVYIPAGRYLISETLKIDKASGLVVRGEGAMGHKAWLMSINSSQSLLVWTGKKDGVMIHAHGTFGCRWEKLAFCGRKIDYKNPQDQWIHEKERAGIILLFTSEVGFGNMVHYMSDVSFGQADTGIQFGSETTLKNCDSDWLFDAVHFAMLNTAVKFKHSQAVDYTFNFIFTAAVKTVFDFESGGNLTVNTLQSTCCDLILNIRDSAWCNGTFLLNSVRAECTYGGSKHRHQLLKANPGKNGGLAIVKFNNFNDVQWAWNKTNVDIPLCEIGPNAMVSFENSIFESPVAVVNGSDKANAYLIIKDSALRNVMPLELYIKSNATGYYKSMNIIQGGLEVWTDMIKWPENKKDESK